MRDSDRVELHRLLRAYADRIDAADFESVGQLFEHGAWNTRHGAEEASAYLHRNMIVYPDGSPRSRHTFSAATMSMTGPNTAEASSSIVLYQQVDPTVAPTINGVLDYHDRFVSENDEWRFDHRDVHPVLSDFGRHLHDAPPPPTDSIYAVGVGSPAVPDYDAVLSAVAGDAASADCGFPHRRSVIGASTVESRHPGVATVRTSSIVFEQRGHTHTIHAVDVIDRVDELSCESSEWIITKRLEQSRFSPGESVLSTPVAGTSSPAESDLTEITRLNVAYTRLIDAGDVDGFASLYARGRWNGIDGSPAVSDWLRRWVILYDGSPRTYHHLSNLVIDIDGNHASSSSTLSVFQLVPGERDLRLITINEYSDEYVRDATGRWWWKERVIAPRFVGDTSTHRTGPPDW